MAISNAELVGYLSIGGTAVALTVSFAYFVAKAFSGTSRQAVAMVTPAAAPTTNTVAENKERIAEILKNQDRKEVKPQMNKLETAVAEVPQVNPPVAVNNVNPDMDMTVVGSVKTSKIGWLTINSGENAGEIYYLEEGNNTVGRDATNTIAVNDMYMSSVQCDIKVVDGKIALFDLGSRSGTKINDRVVTGKVINLGSTVTFGDTKLKVLKIDNPGQFEYAVNSNETIMDSGDKKGVVLVAVAGPDAGNSYLLQEGVNKIGRGSDSNICLSDKTVSRKHAVIKCENGVLTIFDVGSTTRTELDGLKLTGAPLRGGEVITAGKTKFSLTVATS
jgi:pSer/pThr/pTyr-binding forkhead associated (FHA) protein